MVPPVVAEMIKTKKLFGYRTTADLIASRSGAGPDSSVQRAKP